MNRTVPFFNGCLLQATSLQVRLEEFIPGSRCRCSGRSRSRPHKPFDRRHDLSYVEDRRARRTKSLAFLARIMHRFLSRSDESDRPECVAPRARAPVCGSAPANVLYGTLRSLTECNAGGAQRTPDDFVAAVENLCIIRAKRLHHKNI